MGSSKSGTGVPDYEKERIHARVKADLVAPEEQRRARKPRSVPVAGAADKKKKKKRQPAANQHS